MGFPTELLIEEEAEPPDGLGGVMTMSLPYRVVRSAGQKPLSFCQEKCMRSHFSTSMVIPMSARALAVRWRVASRRTLLMDREEEITWRPRLSM